MGIIIKNEENIAIAKVAEPEKISLAGNPNYVVIDSNKESYQKPGSIILELNTNGYTVEKSVFHDIRERIFHNLSEFTITEFDNGTKYHYKGTPSENIRYNGEKHYTFIDESDYTNFITFELDKDKSVTISNLINCLSDNPFIKENCNIEDITSVPENKYAIEIRYKSPSIKSAFNIDKGKYNFLKIKGNLSIRYDLFDFELKVQDGKGKENPYIKESQTRIEYTDLRTNTKRAIIGTRDRNEVNGNTFFLDEDRHITTENIKACLLNDPFIKGGFDISTPFRRQDGTINKGDTIRIFSKKKKISSALASFHTNNIFIIEYHNEQIYFEQDSLLEDNDTCEIQIEVYKDTGVMPGTEDFNNMGTYVTTLSKTYYGEPVWFDVNTIWANQNKYSDELFKCEGKDWHNTDTDTNFRFVAKRYDGANNETFYYSDVLHTLTGYRRSLEQNELSAYVFDASAKNSVAPLTCMPAVTHIRGQKQYFNFILANATNKKEKLSLLYKVYSQSDSYLAQATLREQNIGEFSAVNTACLDIDSVIAEHPNAGIVKVYLCHQGQIVSQPMIFTILPECLYTVNDFAFLNSLGGWSSFNFGGMRQTEFKTGKDTIFKTHTPHHNRTADIESVVRKEMDEQFMVETIPVDAIVADWAKEISASMAVYELASQKYIVVDELNVKHNSRDDLFTLQMKYHYSDSYGRV